MQRKLLCVFLVLAAVLLLLAGCDTEPKPDGTEPQPTLPALNGPAAGESAEPPAQTAAPTAVPEPLTEEAVPELDSRTVGIPEVRGPAGSMYAVSYQGALCRDPIHADVDGDGQKELLYRSAGTANGTVNEAIWIYGLEDGWPIQKGASLFQIGGAKTELVEQDGRAFYKYTPQAKNAESQLLPVTLENGKLCLNGGELPAGMELLAEEGGYYGRSYRRMKQLAGDRILREENNWFLIREPGTLVSEADWEGSSCQCVLMTSNGVTVGGAVFWWEEADGSRSCSYNAEGPAVQKAEPEKLEGLTEQQLTKQLGKPQFTQLRTENGISVLCWFTEEGQLLTVQLQDKVIHASLEQVLAE